MIMTLPGLCLCKCVLGKYKLKVYLLLLLNFYLSNISSVCVCVGGGGGLLLKVFFFHRLKNKRNFRENVFCQGNVMKMLGNFEWTQMWQPWLF